MLTARLAEGWTGLLADQGDVRRRLTSTLLVGASLAAGLTLLVASFAGYRLRAGAPD